MVVASVYVPSSTAFGCVYVDGLDDAHSVH